MIVLLCHCDNDSKGHKIHNTPFCHCHGDVKGHQHLPMPDPPGTTRLEIIRAKLQSVRDHD